MPFLITKINSHIPHSKYICVCMYGLQNEYELQRLQQSSKDSRDGLSICVAKSSRPRPRGAAAGAAGAGLESKAEQGWSGKGFAVETGGQAGS